MFKTRFTKPLMARALCCTLLFGVAGGVCVAQDDKKPRPPKPKIEVPQPPKKDPPREGDKGGKKNDGKKGDGEVLASFFRRFIG